MSELQLYGTKKSSALLLLSLLSVNAYVDGKLSVVRQKHMFWQTLLQRDNRNTYLVYCPDTDNGAKPLFAREATTAFLKVNMKAVTRSRNKVRTTVQQVMPVAKVRRD